MQGSVFSMHIIIILWNGIGLWGDKICYVGQGPRVVLTSIMVHFQQSQSTSVRSPPKKKFKASIYRTERENGFDFVLPREPYFFICIVK